RCHFATEPGRIGAGARELSMRTASGQSDEAGPLLEVSRLSVEYRRGAGFLGLGRSQVVHAVRDVSFRLPRQRVLAVVGESGGGAGRRPALPRPLLPPPPAVNGRIVFDGADVRALDSGRLRAYRRRAQIVFQNPTSSLNPHKTVADIVARPLVLEGVPRDDRRS